MVRDNTIREQAIAWAVRTGDPAFEEWDAFVLWLEADPAHSAAYDEAIAAVEEAAEALPSVPEADNDDRPAISSTRRRWVAGAMATALTLAIAVGVWQMRDPSYALETAPGETRVVELGNGEQIALAGDSRIVLDRNDPRVASLERGQALFTLQHDSSRPFTVTVGEDKLVDIGTVFEVQRTRDRVSVAVSEGAVLFNPAKQRARIDPGQRLTSEVGSDAYFIAPLPLAQVGEWLEGRLSFQDATLAEVAESLARATGVAFTAAPRTAARRVSGSLLLGPVRSDPRQLGPLLGVTVRYTGAAWEIEAR